LSTLDDQDPPVTDVSIEDMQAALREGATVVDVREPFEWASGHVAGIRHIPMHDVPPRMAELADLAPVYVLCESGNRSWQVAAFLKRHGINAYNVDGGMAGWRARRFPMETGSVASPTGDAS
jgi:rhodanese-related sulfurtransferase